MFSSAESQDLDGSWELMRGQGGGEPIPEAAIQRAWLVVTGNQYVMRVGDDTLTGTWRPGADPDHGHIDATASEGRFRGRVLLGVYRLDGCRLTTSFAAPGKGRSRDFTSGDMVHVWEMLTAVVRVRRPGDPSDPSPSPWDDDKG